MDQWLMIVFRQLFLYCLPVIVSLILVIQIESRLTGTAVPHPFFAIKWRGTWLPFLAAIAFHRAIIIALPNSVSGGVKAAAVRAGAHVLLCLLGFLLFSYSLSNQESPGMSSFQHWWAKVLMFFNLCAAALHLLPLPGLLVGECLARSGLGDYCRPWFNRELGWKVLTVLAATPLLDLILGGYVIFPVYHWLSEVATP